jgi:hypothetical protein
VIRVVVSDLAIGLLLVSLGGGLSSCSPVGLVGDDCTAAPCAPGLVCGATGRCEEPPAPPPPPCQQDADCVLDGDASGRVCDAGVCRFDDCFVDAQCGTRICVDGTCAPRIPCVDDEACGDDGLCVDNVCRPPCLADDDCALSVGGIGLQACIEGQCRQRCLGDATCVGGGLCEDNVCVEPACVESAECGDGNFLCEGGRCASFTPCRTDEECFDPNFECAVDLEPARCIERPTCRSDAECGLQALCLERHCRPVEGCSVAEPCTRATDECLASRCVRRPLCRSGADCAADERCVELTCVAAPDPIPAARVEVADAFGPCLERCRRVVVVGERLELLAQGYDDAGGPIEAQLPLVLSIEDVVTIESAPVGAVLHALAPGQVSVDVGGVELELVVVEPAAVDELMVVVQEADGSAPPSGTFARADRVVELDERGVARFSGAATVGAVVARTPDGRGVGVVGVSGGVTVRLALPAPAPASAPVADLAPLSVTVTSTGDETGPVGLGLVLPSVRSATELTVSRLLGDVVVAPLIIPVIGEIPVGIPSSLTAEATLQLLGAQSLRPRAEVVVAAGPAFVLAVEDRREQDVIIGLALGGDPLAFARELLVASETADVALAAAGVLEGRPLVEDAADRDGDGDATERVPDFVGGPAIEVRPGRPPQERGAFSAAPPRGAVATIVVAGLVLPGRLVPTGASVLRGALDEQGQPIAETFKAVPPPPGLATSRRLLALIADFDDERLSSRAVLVDEALPRGAPLGALLDPPTGARLLAGIPSPGDRTALLPTVVGADLVRLRLRDESGVVELYAAPVPSLQLPPGIGEAFCERLDAFVVGGLAALSAGSVGAIDVVATKAASAPAE